MQNTSLKNLFYLNPDVAFLNFGSFGATPKPIMEDYHKWQLELEREPVQFMTVKGNEYLKQSREALGNFIGCSGDDVVFVTNPSYAVNIVAKSLKLNPGDEILATNLEYGACDKTWQYYCKKAGAKYVRQSLTLPLTSKEKIVEEFFKGCNSKTKLIFINQITSATALILPVKEICAAAKERGILTFVDGAHVPGHIPLNLSELKADMYTGACHKWMMTPKGCSFLFVRKEHQDMLDPLLISWGYDAMFPSHSKFIDYHQLQGTRDFSAFLTVPKALSFMKENNWEKVSSDCKKMVIDNAKRFCDLVGSEPISPLSTEYLGQMFSIPVRCKEPEKLKQLLYEKYKVELPVFRQDDLRFIRYSVNAFNSQTDLDKLYDALKDIQSKTDYLA
ncbi:MAG: aminotransferase, partial [Bacteroidetes bacterium]|jgi:isopenicillin-N epimerase|nr:aminotransferase [Bacteroidota bacterium]